MLLLLSILKASSLPFASQYWAKSSLQVPQRFLGLIRQGPWRGGFEPASDVEATEVELVEGRVPDDLKGTLYRNGPGRIRVGNSAYGHWFDGDGYITAVAFRGRTAQVSFRGKYVRTDRFRAQEAAGGDNEPFACRGAWTQRGNLGSPWSWIDNIFRIPTNPSNTNLLYFANR